MASPPIGLRLREIRKKKGITQTELAKTAGISVSYLNLIEHNRRTVGGPLLDRLATLLDVDLEQISTLQDACIVQDLLEMAGDPLFRESQLEADGPQNIVWRHPNWGRGVLKLYHAYLAANEKSEALSERLHNTVLTDARHRILSLITSIRSFSEILREYSDLSEEQRAHFVSLLAAESETLGGAARSLFDFIHEIDSRAYAQTPANEVNEFIIDFGNYFPELEIAAKDLRKRLGCDDAGAGRHLEDFLKRVHRVDIRFGQVSPGTVPGLSARYSFDKTRNVLTIDETLPESSTRFLMAQVLFDCEFHEVLKELVEHRTLTSIDAKNRAYHALARYGAGAVLLPYDAFLAEAEKRRYDVDLLGSKFNVSFEQACHRLVTLRNPSALGLPLAFLRVDPAGNVSKRFNLPNLRMPNHIGACSLWPVFRAFQTPEQIVTRLVSFPNDDKFVFVARTVMKRAVGFASVPRIYSVMIGFDAMHAEKTVYGDGLGPISKQQPVLVGTNCRLCPRDTCQHRAHASTVSFGEDALSE